LREHAPPKDQATDRQALKEQYLSSKGREGSDPYSWHYLKNKVEKREAIGANYKGTRIQAADTPTSTS